jgi:glutamyl-Q tRNA(Asp) synthetase
MSTPVFRFAPSPNGRLHLGHAYSALFTAHWAERMGGRFLLRIEDIDRARCKPEFTEAIFDDLSWLGLDWEEPVMKQSERMDVYAAAAAELRTLRLIYPCFCSRTEVAAHADGSDPDGAPIYGGSCRHLSEDEIEAHLRAGKIPQWRLATDAAAERLGVMTYSIAGPSPADRPKLRYAQPQRWGDAVVVRKDTPTSYHLSVVVDDAAQGITHVTRGRDMEAATDLHILLQRLLGLPSPIYSFHKLLLDDTGNKLAKSKGSPSLASLRAEGWTPDDVRRAVGFQAASAALRK